MGRPKLEIDEKTVENLAAIHCTMIEIAAVVGCSVDTLENRFSDIIKKGRERGKMSLKRLQWEAANKGNTTMLIWLGKQYLDQTDKVEQRMDRELIDRANKIKEMDEAQAIRYVQTLIKNVDQKAS